MGKEDFEIPSDSDGEIVDGVMLSDLNFTDLYIGERGPCFMRGLEDNKEPLVEVPKGLVLDLERMKEKVFAIGANESEFVIDMDDNRYRVTKSQGEESTYYHVRKAMFPIPRISKLGIDPLIVRSLGQIGRPGGAGRAPGRGLILIAGATGQGKTTTACSLIQEYLINFGDVAITIEDPPELKLEGRHGPYGLCRQHRVRDGKFAPLLREALRQNPRYIMVGEIRDPEGASETLNAAQSGHVVIATIHGGSIEEALTRLLKYVAASLTDELARNMLADGIACVLHQTMKKISTGDGRAKRSVLIRSLFFGKHEGMRTKIREGRINHLNTEIDQQEALLKKGELPIPLNQTSIREIRGSR